MVRKVGLKPRFWVESATIYGHQTPMGSRIYRRIALHIVSLKPRHNEVAPTVRRLRVLAIDSWACLFCCTWVYQLEDCILSNYKYLQHNNVFFPGFFFILVQGIEVWPGLACGQSSDFPLTSGLLDTAWQDHLVPEFHGGSIQRRSNHNMVRPRLGHVT